MPSLRPWILVALSGAVLGPVTNSSAQVAGMAVATGTELVAPRCAASRAPLDTLVIALVAEGITQPLTKLDFRIDLMTSSGGSTFVRVDASPGYSSASVVMGDTVLLQIVPDAGCSALVSAKVVATVRLLVSGVWEWIRYTDTVQAGAPPRSYTDCTGTSHALGLWGCAELDINDPNIGIADERATISMLKARY